MAVNYATLKISDWNKQDEESTAELEAFDEITTESSEINDTFNDLGL